jgi:uncharacterized protein YggE
VFRGNNPAAACVERIVTKTTRMLALLALAFAVSVAYAQRPRDRSRAAEPSVIRTTGTATVKAPPDEARITIGVLSRSKTAEEAASANASQVQEVIQALRDELGQSGDLQTQNYSIYPEYNPPGRDGGEPEITGYRAQNAVEVHITDISKVGKAIDAATKVGSNQINGIVFGIQDETELQAKALQEAARKARASADALAEGLGLKVRRIVYVEEGQPATVQPRRYAMAEMAMSAKAATPIEAGEVEVQATVTMTVEFDQQ